MIIRQGLNFAVHLLAGAVLGALVVMAAKRMRDARDEPLEPRYPPPPSAHEPAATSPAG